MAFAISVIVFLAVSGVYIIPVHGDTCPAAWDGSVGFDCPGYFDSVDEWYCCDAGETSQYCCDFNDYYNYGYLSTGVIVGVVVGCILFVLFVTSIIACCVCCARKPPRYPVSTHIHTTTIATPTERPAPIMTVNAPPGYYTPSAQAAPPPPRAPKESKPGQYQQFQNEPVYPNN